MVAARAAAALVPVAHTAIEDKAAAGRAAVDAPAASLQCSDAIRGIFANHSADDLVLQARGRRGASDMSRGTSDMSRGASDMSRGVSDASRGASDAIRGVSDMSRGASDPSRGASDMSLGASDMSRGVSDASRGTSDASRGASDMSRGASDMSHGASDMSRIASDASRGVSDMSRGVSDMSPGASDASRGASDASHGASDMSLGSDAIRGIFANHTADDLVLQAGCDPCSHYIVQCGRRFRGGDIVPPGPYEIAVRLIGGAPPIIIERHGKQWAELRVTNSEISLQPIGWGGSRFQLTYRNHKTGKWSGKLPGKGNREDERVSAGEVDQLVTSLQTAEGSCGAFLDELSADAEDRVLWTQAIATHWPTANSAAAVNRNEQNLPQPPNSPRAVQGARPRDDAAPHSPFERSLRERLVPVVLKTGHCVAFHFSTTKVTVCEAGTADTYKEPDLGKAQAGDGQVIYNRAGDIKFGMTVGADLSDVRSPYRRRFCALTSELDKDTVHTLVVQLAGDRSGFGKDLIRCIFSAGEEANWSSNKDRNVPFATPGDERRPANVQRVGSEESAAAGARSRFAQVTRQMEAASPGAGGLFLPSIYRRVSPAATAGCGDFEWMHDDDDQVK